MSSARTRAEPTVLFDLSVLCTDARVRGIGRYVADLALGLARSLRKSPDLRVLGIERVEWGGHAKISDDIEGALLRLSQAPRENHWSWAYRQRIGQARAAREVSPDLLHTGHPNATPLGHFDCPRIVTCHDLIPLRFPRQYLDWRDGYRRGRQWLDYRRYHAADHVIAVSESTANDLVTLLGVSSKRITVVYNGVDLSRWSPKSELTDRQICEQYGLSPRSYVLYVGDADFRKNADSMLAALARLRQRRKGSRLVLAWAAQLDRESIERLRDLARADGIVDALVLLGYVSDAELAALYRNAVAQLFVSRAEGFGYPVVEAMASGCPVVTSDRSSLAEIAGDAALQLDPDDPDGIAEAISVLETDSREHERWRARGLERARHFSLERMASETLNVYRDVIRLPH